MKTNKQNKITKRTINGLSKNKSYCISINEMWTASPRLLKSSLCYLKKIKCYLKIGYCNGLYFTLSPEVLCGEGNPALIFENKLRGEKRALSGLPECFKKDGRYNRAKSIITAESNLKRNLQEEVCTSLKNCLKAIQNAKKRYTTEGMR